MTLWLLGILSINSVLSLTLAAMLHTDVTIVTKTGQVRAHRAILASHSTYLRKLMISNLEDLGETEEPVLVFKDMSADHLKLMMQFFYNGEVDIVAGMTNRD